MTLEDKLRTYREKTARIAILELEIQGLEAEIKLSTGIQETDEETIAGMAYRRSLDGGGGSDNSSKVERVALNYKAEQDRLSKPHDISYLYEQIRDKQGELRRLKEEIAPMKIALDGLSERERLIIDEFYIKNNSWYIVGVRYQEKYKQYIVQDTLKKIRTRAFIKLNRILNGA